MKSQDRIVVHGTVFVILPQAGVLIGIQCLAQMIDAVQLVKNTEGNHVGVVIVGEVSGRFGKLRRFLGRQSSETNW